MGSVCHAYVGNLFDVAWFSRKIYAQLEKGVGPVCHGYMCVLYM